MTRRDPKSTRDGPKTTQDDPKTPKSRPKTPQDEIKTVFQPERKALRSPGPFKIENSFKDLQRPSKTNRSSFHPHLQHSCLDVDGFSNAVPPFKPGETPSPRRPPPVGHILSYFAIPCHALPYLVIFCHILSYFLIFVDMFVTVFLFISCHVLSYLLLSSHIFSDFCHNPQVVLTLHWL